jgi:hypothetical protein
LATDLVIRAIAALAFVAATLPATAQQMPAPAAEVPMLDPYVPPSARPKTMRVPVATESASLDTQVEGKLRTRFEAAANGGATLTREQARSAGLGAIAEKFEAIDRAKRGAITFEDYLSYLRAQRAAINR